MKRHLCQSVDGALKNWSLREWKNVASANDISVERCKEMFRAYQRQGKRVIPIGDCDNFDYQTGCKGHEA